MAYMVYVNIQQEVDSVLFGNESLHGIPNIVDKKSTKSSVQNEIEKIRQVNESLVDLLLQ